MTKFLLSVVALSWFILVADAFSYPLDGAKRTGIERLEGYRLAQEGKVRGRRLHPGALLSTEQVRLRLRKQRDLQLPEPDEEFSTRIAELLGDQPNAWGIAVLDLSDPEQPVYAEHRAQVPFNPGSVGKLAVALGLFRALANAYPQDIAGRERTLRESLVTADRFIYYDSHDVPFWDSGSRRLIHRPLREGDQANLWTWLDWMLSASSNAAASMVMKQMMLLHAFGDRYPVPGERTDTFFQQTSRGALGAVLHDAMTAGVEASGASPDRLWQGKFFTRAGKRAVPGTRSYATPRALMRVLLHIEQGKAIDPFSSRAIKRLLYLTQKRIRYASSPALFDAAVYFKSGSLYQCREEEGYRCGKYRGNAVNLLNSVAIVEQPPGTDEGLFYMVVVTSNVLKHNAAVAHQTLATRIHRLLQKRHAGRSENNIVERDD